MKLRTALSAIKNNWKGWRTKRKIVVLESDDWGSIRMPSKEVEKKLIESGFLIQSKSNERYDALESAQDFEALFNVLNKFRDKNDRHPLFTANTIMTNPDFEKIKASGFTKYRSEPFTQTYCNYPDSHSNSFELFQEGIEAGLLLPQYHGNEHINTNRWMQALQSKKSDASAVFNYGMVGITAKDKTEARNKLMIAYDFDDNEERLQQIDRLAKGFNAFDNCFGFKSNSFIAPVYTWHESVEKMLSKKGVQCIQSGKVQIQPNAPNKKHYTGERNIYGQSYIVRNVFFEPIFYSESIVQKTLSYIRAAFLLNKPAVISTHRCNYMGHINEKNRKNGLKELEALLREVTNKWPDVEFMSSPELGEIIAGE